MPTDADLKRLFVSEVIRMVDDSEWAPIEHRVIQKEIDLLWEEVSRRKTLDSVSVKFVPWAENPNISAIGKRFLILPPREKKGVCIGYATPYWSLGWSGVFQSEFGDAVLSSFISSCGIHVDRNCRVSALLFIWRVYGSTPHLHHWRSGRFWNQLEELIVGPPCGDAAEFAYRFLVDNDRSDAESLVNWSAFEGFDQRLSKHARLLDDMFNVLDIDVHRTAYHLLRAVDLLEGSPQEAVVAMCATIDAAKVFFEREGEKVTTEGLCYRLGFPYEVAQELDALEKVRNLLCAHRAIAIWWDFGEIYGQRIAVWFGLTWRVFRQTCAYERKHRSSDPFPSDWSSWWKKNAVALWKGLGYAPLP